MIFSIAHVVDVNYAAMSQLTILSIIPSAESAAGRLNINVLVCV